MPRYGHNSKTKELYKNIKKLREIDKLSYRKIGEMFNVSYQYVQQLCPIKVKREKKLFLPHIKYRPIKEKILILQNNKCAICNIELTYETASLDHDHLCCPKRLKCDGKCVRGVLCSKCNIGLGAFKDNINNLYKAIKYLSI